MSDITNLELNISKSELISVDIPDELTKKMRFVNKQGVPYLEWTCKKCDQLRNNMESHRHGSV